MNKRKNKLKFKKRYIFYIIYILIIVNTIYQRELPVICGLPGCGDHDSSLYMFLLLLLPIFELAFFHKTNKKITNYFFILLIIILSFLTFMEKKEYKDNRKLLENYQKCIVSYNCKCNDSNSCNCTYCQDYDNNSGKCSSKTESISCKEYWVQKNIEEE